MLVKPKKGAGRKPVNISNPFVSKHYDEDLQEDYYENSLNNLDNTEIDINVNDVLVGCIRSFKAELPNASSQEYVKHQYVLRCYKTLDVITRQSVQDLLRCSEKQAKRYIQVIKLCNLFLERHFAHKRTNIIGYVDTTKQQFVGGIIPYVKTGTMDGL